MEKNENNEMEEYEKDEESEKYVWILYVLTVVDTILAIIPTESIIPVTATKIGSFTIFKYAFSLITSVYVVYYIVTKGIENITLIIFSFVWIMFFISRTVSFFGILSRF